MKKYIFLLLVSSLCTIETMAQTKIEGTIDKYIQWTFDGQTLTIFNDGIKVRYMQLPDYDNTSKLAPWIKKKLANSIERVVIQGGINRIGSCNFVGCNYLSEVIFEQQGVTEIGWGAFMNCTNLHTISLPTTLTSIETIAFANCSSLSSVRIPAQCKVEEQAFVSCGITSLDISPTAVIGPYAFAKEGDVDGTVRHFLYNGEIVGMPNYINKRNCNEYGLSLTAVDNYLNRNSRTKNDIRDDAITSDIDDNIPVASNVQNDVYALIIGNENYYHDTPVACARHDAYVFKQYCINALGIPQGNIKAYYDATKMMINEEAFDWLENDIKDRAYKRLIVYYAGHGVPDLRKRNEAYLLPTDVNGRMPHFGIRLNEFYSRLGALGFARTAIFMDACFSGGITEGTRGAQVAAEDVDVQNPSVVVFSAAQGNEESQQYVEQGHGLFTYYLLKTLQEHKQYNSSIAFGNLSDNIRENVQKTIDASNNRLKQQTPSTQSGYANWRNWAF